MIILDMPRISDDIRMILNAGIKQREVARMLEINHSTVLPMKKYSKTGSVDNKKRSGRPMIPTERHRRKILQVLEE